MATTYTLISSNVLTGSAASVTFSSIPSTYTDLVLRWSVRDDAAGSAFDTLLVTFNGVGGTSYSRTGIRGDGTSAVSGRTSSAASLQLSQGVDASTATANTFASGEMYVPSYLVSQNKPVGIITAQEDAANGTSAYLWAYAGLFSNTSAISSITCAVSGANLLTGSSFYLYGIKNS